MPGEMTGEELRDNISEILKELIGNKRDLLRLIEDRLSLSVPKSYTYRRIVEKLANEGKEKEFCHLFQSDSFADMLRLFRKGTILSFFTNDELRTIGERFCRDKYDPTNRASLITSIGRNVTEDRLISTFLVNNSENEDQHLVQQQRKWVIGPLGLLRSKVSRGWSNSFELIAVLDTYLRDSHQFAGFLEELREVDWKSITDDPMRREKCIQLVLAYFDDDLIIEILNLLISRALLQITTIRKHDGLIVSPYGVFEERYGGYEELVSLLLSSFRMEKNYLDAELRSEGITEGPLELRVREKCLKKTPREIIEIFFGLGPSLIKLAEELGLVALDRTRDKEDLLRVILLRLGFTFPPKLEGISSYSSDLRRCRRQLESEVDEDRRRGIWNRVYSETERILRDLILFFFSCVWESKLTEYYRNEAKAKKLKEMIRKEFDLMKPVDVLTFGQLCGLLSRINKRIRSNESLKEKAEQTIGRSYIAPPRDIRQLSLVGGARTALTGIHPTKAKTIDSLKTLDTLINVSDNWSFRSGSVRIFPYLVRVREESTNEFGISKLTVIDEEGNEWTLKKSGMWIRPEFAYYMMSDAEYLAIEPILMEKYW